MHSHVKTNAIKIAISEDHALVRRAFKDYINQYPDLKVVLEVNDGKKLLKSLSQAKIDIDVLLLDLYAPGTDGRDALKVITKLHPSIKVVIVSACDDQKIINDLFELGAFAFVSKMTDPDELYEAIRSAYNKQIYKNGFYKLNKNVQLTDQEVTLLELIWAEKTNEEIASTMCLSMSAIEKLRHQLKRKTKSKTTVGLIKYAIDRRIINPDIVEFN
ncbi:MAG: response regulator transcription factor [Agriterribacter sp.]